MRGAARQPETPTGPAASPAGANTATPWTVGLSGLSLRLRVTPRGGADALEGIAMLSDGRPVVLARVRALPADGAANAAVEALVATAVGVPKRDVRVAAGRTQRTKTVEIDGDGATLASAIAAALASAGLGRRGKGDRA
ncbi:DUF167 family protein [Pseudoxanthobacter sp. M-2]|uniref:DUF167 family protein n=1 Tax=Pseudoxanthobacter sp. M-2 TaxID=3078754 RepID=UPI0038FC5EF5